MNDRLRQALAEALRIPSDTINTDDSSETLEAWDSLGHLDVILAVEQEFGVHFLTDEIPQMTSIGDLEAALVRKGRP